MNTDTCDQCGRVSFLIQDGLCPGCESKNNIETVKKLMSDDKDTYVFVTGAERIRLERQRQIKSEGWTPEHDDKHKSFQMSRAASCYCFQAASGTEPSRQANYWWPWAKKWWKPSDDPIRDLVKAGALIAAEIDRLQRKQCEALSKASVKYAAK